MSTAAADATFCRPVPGRERNICQREKTRGLAMGRCQGNEDTKPLLCAQYWCKRKRRYKTHALLKGPPHHLRGASFIILVSRLISTLWRKLMCLLHILRLGSTGRAVGRMASASSVECGVGKCAYPLRATMSFKRSVGVTTTLANCRAKPLFSADAAMRPMAAAVPCRGYRRLLPPCCVDSS